MTYLDEQIAYAKQLNEAGDYCITKARNRLAELRALKLAREALEAWREADPDRFMKAKAACDAIDALVEEK